MRNHETDIYIDYYFKYNNEEKEHWFEYEIPESVCVEAIREILSFYNVETSNDISSKHYVKDKDIRVGDYVVIIKAGDVIPRVESVKYERRDVCRGYDDSRRGRVEEGRGSHRKKQEDRSFR